MEREDPKGIQTVFEWVHLLYDELSAPKYLLEIKGADHFYFSGPPDQRMEKQIKPEMMACLDTVGRYMIQFLSRNLLGKTPGNDALVHNDPMIIRYLGSSK